MDIYSGRDKVSALVRDVPVPKMFRVRQIFEGPEIPSGDVREVLTQRLKRDSGCERMDGLRIAVAVGSRGICNLPEIVRAVIAYLKDMGARPFIVPSMGSHGGATAEGQREVLRSLDITEDTAGCPILSSMETVCVGRNEEGREVLVDKNAAEADGIVLIARIKPHTAFRGRYESGMMKMMAIGLAKQKGAERTHNEGVGNLAKNVYLNGKAVIAHCNVLFAVAILENAYDQTAELHVVPAGQIEEREPGLLKKAFGYMPGILTGDCDVLAVDRVGKNISGEGMDPNISGRFILPQYAQGGICAQKVAILDLTEETHGNCHGICNADVISQAVFNKADFEAFYINSITSTVLTLAKIPMIMKNHRECLQVCLRSCVGTDRVNPRLVRIADTLHLEHILLSEAYWDEAQKMAGLAVESEPFEMEFDREGNLF
ncbi:MAG: DUF362 domain-containing protein [Enterocloster asparagiformis]|nr:DUF362 domain-containing protein [Enterocloster asparagiformis]